jgi:hypothetical protein
LFEIKQFDWIVIFDCAVTTPPGDVDYSMTNPLFADGSNFPCKAYAAGPITATIAAGVESIILEVLIQNEV